jgi:glycosyltransferase involved in cell wall biosynthesis
MTGRDDTPGVILFAMTHTAQGGLREIWNDVATGLEARGHSVGRFALYPPVDLAGASEAVAEGWRHILPARPGLSGMVRLLWALVRYLREVRPAAIVTAAPLANFFVPLAVRLAGTDTLVAISHHSPVDTHNPAINWLDGWSGRLGCVAAVISVSAAVGASLEGKAAAYRAKRTTIGNALPDRIEALLDRLYEMGEGAKVPGRIVALGRLSYQKNYPMLLRAMAFVPGGTLDIVGSGEDEEELRALAAAVGVAGRVRFMGVMTREDALVHAASAQIFAQVSHFEGHSLALIEAARLGMPLVVSDAPVQIEGVTAKDGERCGRIVSLGDDRALGNCLADLLRDGEERARLSTCARRLGAEASNRAMIDAYESLLVSFGAR